MRIALVTPTKDRPFALNLCAKYVRRMTAPILSHHKVAWFICSDSELDVTGDNFNSEHLPIFPYRIEETHSAEQSFKFNLYIALSKAQKWGADWVFFVEDDDHYKPTYLQAALGSIRVKGEQDLYPFIVGEWQARYYNISTDYYQVYQKGSHAALCQTGISREVIPLALDYLEHESADVFLDLHLWRLDALRLRRSLYNGNAVTGIKGMPGARGLGVGHKLGAKDSLRGQPAPDGLLEQWIGEADARAYRELQPSRAQSDLPRYAYR